MYQARWIFYLTRGAIYGTLRILSSRFWLLPVGGLILLFYGGNPMAGTAIEIGAVVWFLCRWARRIIGMGAAPERPFGFQKKAKVLKEKPAAVATSMAVAKDSPSVEIARMRLPSHLQAIMLPNPKVDQARPAGPGSAAAPRAAVGGVSA